MPASMIGKLLGHIPVRTTAHYGHLANDINGGNERPILCLSSPEPAMFTHLAN
jgi:hypothetical protein